MKIGIQVSSLKPLLLTPEQVHRSFARMKDLGCQVVQTQWVDFAVPVDSIAASAREFGMESVSVQDFYDIVLERFDYYTALNTATGGIWLCVSRIPERLKYPEGLDLYIEELRAMQDRLTPLGQKLCFHPVTGDFTAIPGRNAVEYLLEHMPELNLCLDLYHLNRNCGDMPGFIRRYGRRICMVHFKDAVGDTLVPAGQGDTNWTGVVDACVKAGVPYAFVEQEKWDRDPYDCMKEAMDWLAGQMK